MPDIPPASPQEGAVKVGPDPTTLTVNHIAVQTADLESSISWYEEFFDARVSWRLEEFSELSKSRLPGLSSLAEVMTGRMRFHLFTRGPEHDSPPVADSNQFQHVCLAVAAPEELRAWHARWHDLYASGKYTFARDEPATGIEVDADGVESFYAFDINGVEFEFAYLPGKRG